MATSNALGPLETSKARSVLRMLRSTNTEIEACALVSSDGHVLASALNPQSDADRVGAMCAALIALATRAGAELQLGELNQLVLEGKAGTMLLTRAGSTGLLAVSAGAGCTLGKVLLDTKAAANSLSTLFLP